MTASDLIWWSMLFMFGMICGGMIRDFQWVRILTRIGIVCDTCGWTPNEHTKLGWDRACPECGNFTVVMRQRNNQP